VADAYDDVPIIEREDPLEPDDAADVVSLDSEVDFDDDTDDDQLPLDEVEAIEAGVLLDDPESLSEADDE